MAESLELIVRVSICRTTRQCPSHFVSCSNLSRPLGRPQSFPNSYFLRTRYKFSAEPIDFFQGSKRDPVIECVRFCRMLVSETWVLVITVPRGCSHGDETRNVIKQARDIYVRMFLPTAADQFLHQMANAFLLVKISTRMAPM
jgi:hypothetical protein